jgi:transcriptional regulator with XRE-family HTH domain
MFRETLKRHGISQREFAAMIRTDYSAVNRWANGKAAVPGAVEVLLMLLDLRPELAHVLRELVPSKRAPRR